GYDRRVVTDADDLPVAHHHGADRHFACSGGQPGLLEGHAHEPCVAHFSSGMGRACCMAPCTACWYCCTCCCGVPAGRGMASMGAPAEGGAAAGASCLLTIIPTIATTTSRLKTPRKARIAICRVPVHPSIAPARVPARCLGHSRP